MRIAGPALAAIAIACLGAPATAQHRTAEPASSSGPARQETPVRVQTSISFFLAGPTGESEEAAKLRERARRIVYEMAARECDVAKEAFAKDCRLEAVNSQINAQRTYPNQQQLEGYTVNGSMTLQVSMR